MRKLIVKPKQHSRGITIDTQQTKRFKRQVECFSRKYSDIYYSYFSERWYNICRE